MGDYTYTLDSSTQIDDHLLINFPNREAVVDEQTVSLTPIETKLLYILVRNAGRIVTTEFLLNRIWPLQDAPRRPASRSHPPVAPQNRGEPQ
ncbi:MAG: winged helix-turn-helix domain-containing protein [Chloroflexi bacterium]|nr:winged helix-turn-helix domain-containing protein [Chloroflexota bacterium]